MTGLPVRSVRKGFGFTGTVCKKRALSASNQKKVQALELEIDAASYRSHPLGGSQPRRVVQRQDTTGPSTNTASETAIS